jgi:hypothetical protein
MSGEEMRKFANDGAENASKSQLTELKRGGGGAYNEKSRDFSCSLPKNQASWDTGRQKKEQGFNHLPSSKSTQMKCEVEKTNTEIQRKPEK